MLLTDALQRHRLRVIYRGVNLRAIEWVCGVLLVKRGTVPIKVVFEGPLGRHACVDSRPFI